MPSSTRAHRSLLALIGEAMHGHGDSRGKRYERLYAPLTAGILPPFAADQSISKENIMVLDRRYSAVPQPLDDPVEAVGLNAPLRPLRRERNSHLGPYNGLKGSVLTS